MFLCTYIFLFFFRQNIYFFLFFFFSFFLMGIYIYIYIFLLDKHTCIFLSRADTDAQYICSKKCSIQGHSHAVTSQTLNGALNAVLDPTFHITQSVGLKSSQLRRYISVCKFVEVSLIQKRLKSNHQINEVDMRGAQKAKPSHATLLKIPLDNSWEACALHMFNGPTYGTIAPQVLQPLLSTSASINRGPYCRDYRYSNQKQAFKQFQFLSSFFLQT